MILLDRINSRAKLTLKIKNLSMKGWNLPKYYKRKWDWDYKNLRIRLKTFRTLIKTLKMNQYCCKIINFQTEKTR